MNKPTSALPIEPRWPVALTVLIVSVLVAILHDRVKLFPDWFHYLLAAALLVSLITVPLTGAKPKWVRLEGFMILLFFGIMQTGVLVGLARLIQEMLNGTEINGLRLLTSSISVWLTNILGSAFWGMLFGLIFFMPFLGMAMGAAVGAISGHFTDYGIDDSFINDVKAKVT